MSVNLLKFMVASRWPYGADVLPGKHTLDVNMQVGRWEGQMGVWWVAQPGAAYVINGTWRDEKFAVWIEDAYGRRVGGIRGSSDEPK